MKFAFISEKVASFPIRAMCRAMRVSPSGYYAWRNRPPSHKELEDERLRAEVRRAHEQSRGTYGVPRVAKELQARGHVVGVRRVARLMRQQGLRGRKRRRFRATTDSSHGHAIAPNLLQRDFRKEAPNRAWVGDVTAVYTGCGWLYLAVLLDLYSRGVVGWATSTNNDTKLALAALENAVALRQPPPGLVHHTDRGSPYASGDYRAALRRHRMKPSMSRTRDCWDNSVAESFFASITGECLDHDWYPTQSSARRAIDDYHDVLQSSTKAFDDRLPQPRRVRTPQSDPSTSSVTKPSTILDQVQAAFVHQSDFSDIFATP
jgi:putative transposase